MKTQRWSRFVSILAATCLAAPLARAEDGFPSVKLSGFLSAVGGKVLSGNPEEATKDFYGVDRPFYVADWANWGTYDKSLSLKPESRLGVQALVKFTEDLSFTSQVVSRGTVPEPNLQWAYLSYTVAPGWEVQLGRKRLPLYYYSDFQDIGVAYPWVTPPPEVYGWEVTNFNGASLRHKASVGGSAVAASLFAGKETVKDDRYMRSFGQTRTNVTWDHILGGDLEVTKGWLTMRGVYVQADASFRNKLDPSTNADQKVKSYDLAANADFDHWFVLSEIGQLTRSYGPHQTNAPVVSLGAGVRLGQWTPFLNVAQYRETTTDPSYATQNYRRGSLILRYDISSSYSLKVQLDKYSEFHGTSFASDSTVLRLAFDMVF